MEPMGIWFENFGLPAVIDACLLQSYNGIIRMFPNWPNNKDAEFQTLRAAGGFLVSSSIHKGNIPEIRIYSENDNELRIYNPWGKDIKVNVLLNEETEGKVMQGEIITLKVKKGQTVWLKAAS